MTDSDGAWKAIDLLDAFESFDELWSPRLVAEANGQAVKIARIRGEFVWHRHDDADELFWVVKGAMRIRLRDGDVTLSEGQVFVVPRGVEHKPEADEEAWIALIEPASVRNTGDVVCDLSRDVKPIRPGGAPGR